jgi:hypothetical protein
MHLTVAQSDMTDDMTHEILDLEMKRQAFADTEGPFQSITGGTIELRCGDGNATFCLNFKWRCTR